MDNKLTIVIVTKRRPQKLKRCLSSLELQSERRFLVLVIDNDLLKSAQVIVSDYTDRLNLDYKSNGLLSVPELRNIGLKNCRTEFLGFVDDDCVLDKDWVKSGLKELEKKQADYVVGRSRLFNQGSLVAQAQHYRQKYWFEFELKGNKLSSFNFDTKNVILRTKKIKKKKIWFDEQMSLGGYDSADTDVGFQLKEKQLKGLYLKEMVVFHQEVENLFGFLKKGYYRGRLAFLIADKWSLKGEFVYLPDYKFLKYLRRIKHWPVEYQRMMELARLSGLRKKSLFFLIKIHDRVYLQGFVNQARRMGKKLDF